MLTQSSGWQLVLTHPDTGRTVAPDVLGDPEFLPSLNSLVEVRIPVRRSPDWVEWPDGTDMELRLDGRVQPVDELVDIEQEAGRTVLVGEGGTELEDRVTAEYQSERRHIAAGELIEANTSYAADVDTPFFETLTDQLLQDLDTTDEFAAALDADPTTPLAAQNGGVEVLQTSWTVTVLDLITLGSYTAAASGNNDGFVGGDRLRFLNVGEYAEFEITNDYEIPAGGAGGIQPRIRGIANGVGSNAAQFDVTIDGNDITTITVDDDHEWHANSFYEAALPPGTHTVRFELSFLGGDTDNVDVDVFNVPDTRYSYDYDNTLSSTQGHLDGPQLFPPAVMAVFDDAQSPFSILTGELSVDMDDTSGDQRLELSNDRGSTWVGADNTATFNHTFADPSATLRVRVTLSRYGTRSGETPRTGYLAQTLHRSTLRGEIRQESLLIDYSQDKSLEGHLNDIARDEYVWSYRIENGTPTVSWTQPGERTADREPDFEANVSVNKQLRTWDAVTIQGSAQSSDERFDGSTTFTALARDRIVPGSDSVTDPTDGTQFTRGEDYELRYNDGEIRILGGGDMSSGTEYEITYRYEAQGMYPTDYTGSNTLVETIPGIVSDRQAEQIAYVLLEIDPGVDSPRWTADVLLPRADQSFDPLEALSLVALELPDDATPLSVRDPPDVTPEGIALRLGSRRALESALRSISNQVRTVSRRS